MHSAATNRKPKGHSNIPDAGSGFGSTKSAADAPLIRAFCECVGAWSIRGALTLAVVSALVLIVMAGRPAQAQTETVLYNFTGGSDGYDIASSLTPDGAGNFYGTAVAGGLGEGYSGYGTVFELSPNGNGSWTETTLYSFCSAPNCTDGAYPDFSHLIFDAAGNLYGTAYSGGANGYGVVFELSPVGTSWTETVLYSFAGGADGEHPFSGLIMDGAGNLYGIAYYDPDGTVFELSPSGSGWTEQVIYSYNSCCNQGFGGLTMDAAGNIFGAEGSTAFELSPSGNGGWTATVIHTFAGAPKDGDVAQYMPVLDQAGNLYGTTAEGGTKNCGTVYKLSPEKKGKWKEKILYSFKGTYDESGKDGNVPAGIVLDSAGNIYGCHGPWWRTRHGNCLRASRPSWQRKLQREDSLGFQRHGRSVPG